MLMSWIWIDSSWTALQICFLVGGDRTKRSAGNERKPTVGVAVKRHLDASAGFCGRTLHPIDLHSKDG